MSWRELWTVHCSRPGCEHAERWTSPDMAAAKMWNHECVKHPLPLPDLATIRGRVKLEPIPDGTKAGEDLASVGSGADDEHEQERWRR